MVYDPPLQAPPSHDRPARILGLGTATPVHVDQADLTAMALEICGGDAGQQAVLRRVYERCGVARRGMCLSQDGRDFGSIYPRDVSPPTSVRMQAFAEHAPPLAERAARAALDDAQLKPERITHLVTVSCTGMMAPGVDAALIQQLELPRDVRRQNIGFMGCHAAINAMEAARCIARSDANARVLVCCVELCSLHLAYQWDLEKIIANALFGDGAAACVVGCEPRDDAWAILETASCLMPDTTREMSWRIGDHGYEMTLSASVPDLVKQSVRGWCDHWLGLAGTRVEAIDHWAIHPGGPKVLSRAAEGLGIDPAHLAVSRAILHDHGNMSSTTVLFILERMGAAQGTCVSLAFGPGLVMEGVLLQR